MEAKKRKQKRAFIDADHCVACGCCVKVCPKHALSVWKGIMARVTMDLCIGCGKCARECPASVIVIQEVQP